MDGAKQNRADCASGTISSFWFLVDPLLHCNLWIKDLRFCTKITVKKEKISKNSALALLDSVETKPDNEHNR